MKKNYWILSLFIVFAISCNKDIGENHIVKQLTPTSVQSILVGSIAVNTTITNNSTLQGVVFVEPGVTLTINPGVTITCSDAAPSQVTLADYKGTLVVTKGAKLVALGTPTNPIVWTSSHPAGSRHYGDWGGIILLGNAPITTAAGAASNNYIGLNGLAGNPGIIYGGPSPADNSGAIAYNRIEYAGGAVLNAGNEVQPLALAGVGNGTVLHHIQVSHSGDDGFGIFVGTVNMNHLLSIDNKDDDFDFDEAYQGRLQFIIAFRTDIADISGSNMIESDNNAATAVFPSTPRTRPFIANATLVGPSGSSVRPGETGCFFSALLVRRHSRIRLLNSLIIAQAFPFALVATPTTHFSFGLHPFDPDASPLLNNIFQSSSLTPVVTLDAEGIGCGIAGTVDPLVIGSLTGNGNSALAHFSDFGLSPLLQPMPAFTGGIDLRDYGFVPTTERGAVLTNDLWTSGPWIAF